MGAATPKSSEGGWEQAFWLAFERSSNGIALVDEQRRFVEVNDALLTILGGSRDEILGASVVDAIPQEERERAQLEWDEFLRSGDYSGGGPIMRLDGSGAEIEVAARLMTVGGRRLAICVVISASESRTASEPSTGAERLLTQREREVVTLIALGQASPRIAEELNISAATVRTHVQHAMVKLGVHTRAQLVATVLSRDDTFHRPLLREDGHGHGHT
jgi:PAS domain S-box-containing protein